MKWMGKLPDHNTAEGPSITLLVDKRCFIQRGLLPFVSKMFWVTDKANYIMSRGVHESGWVGLRGFFDPKKSNLT